MKIFSYDNPVFRTISRIGDIFMLSFYWFVTSLPLITIGAATTAAYDCAFKIIRARDTNVTKDFFNSFKSNFKQATIIWLILAPIGALLLLDLYYWANTDFEISLFMNALGIGLGIIYLATVFLFFPCMQSLKTPLRKPFQPLCLCR